MDPEIRRFCLDAAIKSVSGWTPEDYIRAADKFYGYIMNGRPNTTRDVIESLGRASRDTR